MSFTEIIVIAAVAVVFLGPDKLPEAMVKFAKFFKTFKQTINSARSTFEQEVKIAELKEDAKKYRDAITSTTDSVRKKLTFEELDELKKTASSVTNSVNESLADIKKEFSNPLNSLNSEISADDFADDKKPEAAVDNSNLKVEKAPESANNSNLNNAEKVANV